MLFSVTRDKAQLKVLACARINPVRCNGAFHARVELCIDLVAKRILMRSSSALDLQMN